MYAWDAWDLITNYLMTKFIFLFACVLPPTHLQTILMVIGWNVVCYGLVHHLSLVGFFYIYNPLQRLSFFTLYLGCKQPAEYVEMPMI